MKEGEGEEGNDIQTTLSPTGHVNSPAGTLALVEGGVGAGSLVTLGIMQSAASWLAFGCIVKGAGQHGPPIKG